MVKALLKKQLLETLSFLFSNKKTGKKRSVAGIIGYSILMAYVLVVLAGSFAVFAVAMCVPLVEQGLGWLYFAIMSLVATAFGIFGSVFLTYSGLYEAKDNELLLSMPVPPSVILFSRMLNVYIMALFFEALVLVPTVFIYFLFASPSPLSIIFSCLLILILPLFAVTISCILGWIIAVVASKVRRKNIVTLVFSLAFFVLYFKFYSGLGDYIDNLITNSASLAEDIKTFFYPAYQIGLAAVGNALPFILSALAVFALFAILYAILSATFIKIITSKRGLKKIRYKEKALKVTSEFPALLKREFRHLIASPTYIINCALGSVILIVIAVLAIINAGQFSSVVSEVPEIAPLISTLAALPIAFIVAMNAITAPSISLEGKTIWLLQSLPVSTKHILRAKIAMHVIITAIPALICSIVLAVITYTDIISAIMLPVFSIVFTVLTATLGLLINLRLPNLNWVSETIAVKQSASVVVSMLASIAATILLGGFGGVISMIIPIQYVLLLVTVVTATLTGLLLYLTETVGVKMFRRLG